MYSSSHLEAFPLNPDRKNIFAKNIVGGSGNPPASGSSGFNLGLRALFTGIINVHITHVKEAVQDK